MGWRRGRRVTCVRCVAGDSVSIFTVITKGAIINILVTVCYGLSLCLSWYFFCLSFAFGVVSMT